MRRQEEGKKETRGRRQKGETPARRRREEGKANKASTIGREKGGGKKKAIRRGQGE